MAALVFYPGILLPVVSPLIGGTNLVTAGAVSTFNVLETTTNSVESSFDVETTVAASVTSAFSTRGNVTVITPFQVAGRLTRPVVWPIDAQRFIPSVAFNVYDPVQVSKQLSFGIIQTRDVLKLSLFNVSSSSVHGSFSSSFNVRGLVQAGPPNGSTWIVKQTITTAKNSRFNNMSASSAKVITAFNINGILVTPSVTSFWNLRQQLTPSTISTWQLNARRPAGKLVTFETLFSSTSSKTVKFNVLNPVSAQSVSCQWNLKEGVTASLNSRWADRIRPSVNSNLMAWNVYRQVTPQRLSFFRVGINPAGPVTPSILIKFNTLSGTHASKAVAWNTVGREGFSVLSEFNVKNSVTVSMSSSWNIGPWVNSHIRQLAQERIDFAY